LVARRIDVKVGLEARTLEEPELRGLSRYTTNLVRGLLRRPDIELTLFSRQLPHSDHFDGAGAKIVCCDRGREWAWYDQWLAAEIRNRGIDVFHAPADRGLPIRRSCATVVTVHGSYERARWKLLFPGVKQKLWYWRHEFANVRADAIITVSHTTRSELIHFGYPAHRTHAIYPAAASEFDATPDQSDNDVLMRHGVTQPYFLCVSGYNAHKNLDMLVRAFEMANVPDHDLVIVANHKSGFDAFKNRWESVPIFSRVRLVQVDQPELPALYRRAAVYVNPSKWESFGFQLVEAMACGTPILCSTAHALPEIAADAAEYFDPERPAELSALLKAISNDPARLEALRSAGAKRSRTFSWETTVRQTTEVYGRVSGGSDAA
jgi:glycosyltransferase involved in cell wall biosynthesis